MMKTFNLKTSSKYKLTSWVYIAIVVVILIVINIAANLFSYQIDFTAKKTFSLTGECKAMLDTVDQDIEIVVCRDRINFGANIYVANIAQTVENMAEYSDHIEASFMSVDKNPGLKEQYPTSTLTTSNIIVRLKDDQTKFRIVSMENMFETDDAGRTITESKVEYTLANAIDFVTRTDFPVIYYTTNHMEDTPGEFLTLLAGNNYTVHPLNLVANDLPEDADYIFLFNPKTDFSGLEITKLESFLSNNDQYGKNLFAFMSPEQPELQNLEKFFEEWGIALGDGYLYNTAYSTDAQYNSMMLSYGDINAAGTLYNSLSILTEQTRPVDTLFSSRDYSSTTSLLNAMSYTQHAQSVLADKNPDTDPLYSGSVMAMGTRYVKGNNVQSNVVVSGSYKIIENAYMDSALGNAAYMAQVINYLDADSTKLFIFPKNMETPLLDFPDNSAKTAALIVFVIVIPLALAAVGVYVFIRRRNK